MTERDAFRLGCYLGLAELGVPPEQADRLLEKRADPLSTAANYGGAALGALLGVGLAAPPALGYAGGALAATAANSGVGPEDVRREELLEEYRRLAARARAGARRRRKAPAPDTYRAY